MAGSEFFKPESMYTIMARHFPNWYFFVCCSAHFLVYYHFSLFWNVLFCLCFWSCLGIFLAFLLLPVSSDLSSCVELILNYCDAFLFMFRHIPAFFLCLSIFAYCYRFLICVFSLISHSGFEFQFMFVREHQFYHWLILLLHWLVHLILCCCWLRY